MNAFSLRRCALLVLIAGFGLGGCTTFGTNVSGSFRCEAPDGICAPSSVIDDAAIAAIERETSSTELLSPAGPYRIDDGVGPSERDPAPIATPIQLAASAPVNAPISDPQATPEAETFELTVVFPGFVDASGRVIERRTVQTQVALPGRGDAVDELARRASIPRGGGGLLAAAEAAPRLLALVTPPAQAIPAMAAYQADSNSGESEPIEAIKAEVRAVLAASSPPPSLPVAPVPSKPKPEAGAASAPSPEPMPVRSAGSFPGVVPNIEEQE